MDFAVIQQILRMLMSGEPGALENLSLSAAAQGIEPPNTDNIISSQLGQSLAGFTPGILSGIVAPPEPERIEPKFLGGAGVPTPRNSAVQGDILSLLQGRYPRRETPSLKNTIG